MLECVYVSERESKIVREQSMCVLFNNNNDTIHLLCKVFYIPIAASTFYNILEIFCITSQLDVEV